MLLILPAFTRRPSLVTGCHSFSCANCQYPAICVPELYLSVPRSFHHGGHGHDRDHVHGHHRGLHEIRIHHERGRERQPLCMLGVIRLLEVLLAIADQEGVCRRMYSLVFLELVLLSLESRNVTWNFEILACQPWVTSAKLGLA
jgi:hypothetical protein